MRVSPRASGGSRVEPRFWAPALVGRDPLCARKEEGARERAKKSLAAPSGGGREGGRSRETAGILR